MGLKGKIEAIIYAAEEPITLEQVAFLMKEPVLQELSVERESAAAEALEVAAQEAAERKQNVEQATLEVALAESEELPEELSLNIGVARCARDDKALLQDAATSEEVAASTLEAPVAAEDSAVPETPVQETPAEEPAAEASENAKPAVSSKRKRNEVPPEVKARVRTLIQELIEDYANNDRGMEIRQLAGGYRMATKPEHHDIVKAFAKSLKPPLRLSLPALETLAVVAYKQPVTAPEVGEIRGVDSQGVMATLLERKLVTTAGRKAVIGRPILYKTTKEFLLRFGMNEVSELPSMEEFEKLAQEQSGLFISENEPEPVLSPEEATARLEQASAAAEGADSSSEAENAATEAAPEPATENEVQSEPVASSVAPEETHQS